ncbi:MAG TPA: hypothetical protein VFL16_08630, partial [Steroidobacteraceae bacterium]|nr:hypothetical protein [Steroidobacteraceae bacterium]
TTTTAADAAAAARKEESMVATIAAGSVIRVGMPRRRDSVGDIEVNDDLTPAGAFARRPGPRHGTNSARTSQTPTDSVKLFWS